MTIVNGDIGENDNHSGALPSTVLGGGNGHGMQVAA